MVPERAAGLEALRCYGSKEGTLGGPGHVQIGGAASAMSMDGGEEDRAGSGVVLRMWGQSVGEVLSHNGDRHLHCPLRRRLHQH